MPAIKPLNKQKDCLRKLFLITLIEKGWNQKHLAEICGMTEGQISRVINNPEKHRFETILTVAKKLGLSEIPVVR